MIPLACIYCRLRQTGFPALPPQAPAGLRFLCGCERFRGVGDVWRGLEFGGVLTRYPTEAMSFIRSDMLVSSCLRYGLSAQPKRMTSIPGKRPQKESVVQQGCTTAIVTNYFVVAYIHQTEQRDDRPQLENSPREFCWPTGSVAQRPDRRPQPNRTRVTAKGGTSSPPTIYSGTATTPKGRCSW